jgi:hypothetical protein
MTKTEKWSEWKRLPSPANCRTVEAPIGPGVYQLRHRITHENILFGIGKECRKRMQSLFPKPYGTGTRNNESKRIFVLKNWEVIEYRTLSTVTRGDAAMIEKSLKAACDHIFNT